MEQARSKADGDLVGEPSLATGEEEPWAHEVFIQVLERAQIDG